jgi:ElaB/YqjD/DUF883 family membrane-anchored ribosome-binding protein
MLIQSGGGASLCPLHHHLVTSVYKQLLCRPISGMETTDQYPFSEIGAPHPSRRIGGNAPRRNSALAVDLDQRRLLVRAIMLPGSATGRDQCTRVKGAVHPVTVMRQELFSSLSPSPRRLVMLGQSRYSRATSTNVGEIERRLRSVERRLERVAGRTAAGAMETADHVGETIASALSGMADRFREDGGSMSDEAAKIGSEAGKLGNDAIRRLSKEVEHRPLITLAVAVGVGILVGLAGRRLTAPPG